MRAVWVGQCWGLSADRREIAGDEHSSCEPARIPSADGRPAVEAVTAGHRREAHAAGRLAAALAGDAVTVGRVPVDAVALGSGPIDARAETARRGCLAEDTDIPG